MVRIGLFLVIAACVSVFFPVASVGAPYAAMVVDARTGKVLHSRNADTQLHPASLTKMMTLYIAFEAIKHGEISLDTMVTISANAAAEPPSKLGLRTGQKIQLRYLIRAAAVKSANDAATAIGEAIAGSEAAFARRMNRTAKALGMSRTTFKNAHGLTRTGHMSTARDMTALGRHLLYDHPQYYNLFSRLSTDAGVRTVNNTNSRFLNAYRGADGIKTGYTSAAGFNLVASAERGNERIITTVFGGRSTASRNAKVAELMDLGFRRAPTNASLRRPAAPTYSGGEASPAAPATPTAAGHTIRLVTAVKTSPRPVPRPGQTNPAASEELLAAIETGVENAVEQAVDEAVEEAATIPSVDLAAAPDPVPTTPQRPAHRPAILTASATPVAPVAPVTATYATDDEPEIVTRVSSSGGRHFGINVGSYISRYQAERVLLKTALNELSTLGDALRKVANRPDGWHANFVGMTREGAELACRRLNARNTECQVIGPT
ncbi:MAG: D-alanyl-D-alanine carboxypeptidase [Rhodobacteraceae bacterium]|nr:D-alanyl-D-alanine carboxypeptidase [Paracoccaceae bacterium]